MTKVSVEVVYRGIFQKTLATNITRGIVFRCQERGQDRDRFRPLRRLPRAERNPRQAVRRRGG